MTKYSTYTDKQLIELLKVNDENAFDALYKKYWEPLFTIAASKLKDPWLAEEIIHDIFVDLWNRRHSAEIHGELSHYLAAAVKYRTINARIKQERIKLHEQRLKQIAYDLPPALPASEQEINDLITQLINQLPEKSQLIFRLSRQQGLSNKEISQDLNISEKAVEYHITSALKKIRTSLDTPLLALLFLDLFK